jgi:hypothetical protein
MISEDSLCFESLLPIAMILNPACKVEEWVNFKIVLVNNDESGPWLVIVIFYT